ncbi:hypothetical protein [Phaeobacter sp. 11ANDIMAR09]|uniref:hypothetical protein n=1 Tax=Phaeobacter sp. 11ANDIMAR09 TaxID=1225647 RepID=UPI0006C87CF4|nr:hypothetical protein [Phaeobacter sp. 11ANDIMAR09]KPD12510.1 hypothetical protein AN476_09870 [Phaeobacter sp. 11ANDIMAR09]
MLEWISTLAWWTPLFFLVLHGFVAADLAYEEKSRDLFFAESFWMLVCLALFFILALAASVETHWAAISMIGLLLVAAYIRIASGLWRLQALGFARKRSCIALAIWLVSILTYGRLLVLGLLKYGVPYL